MRHPSRSTPTVQLLPYTPVFRSLLIFVDGSVPDGRCKLEEKIVGLDDRALGAAILDHHLFNILTCDCLERLRRKKLLADLLLPLLKGWVAPRSNSLARLVSRVPRLLEADLGITPDCELLLDLADPVPETPQLAASRRDQIGRAHV